MAQTSYTNQDNSVSEHDVMSVHDHEHEFNLNGIVLNLMRGETVRVAFGDFCTALVEESGHNISWKTLNLGDKYLHLFSLDWQADNKLPTLKDDRYEQNYINKYLNNLVIEQVICDPSDELSESLIKVVMYGGPKVFDSNRDRFGLEQINRLTGSESVKIFKAYEGTTINTFCHDGTWYFSTKRMFDMNESKFGTKRTHGQMVSDIIDIEVLKANLDPKCTYHYVLVHDGNSHLTSIQENKLCLVSVKNLSDFEENIAEYDRVTGSGYFSRSEIFDHGTDIASYLKNETNDTQGIIIHVGEMIFRLYKHAYAARLRMNPFFNTKQEEYFHKYQSNGLTEQNDYKTYTFAAFNFVAVCLFRTLMHFTTFIHEDGQYRFEKKNITQWATFVCSSDECGHVDRHHNALIRNLNKLQRLPYALRQLRAVDFNQVKHHLKYHTSPSELYAMYLTFLAHSDISENYDGQPCLCDIVGYKSVASLRGSIKGFGQM